MSTEVVAHVISLMRAGRSDEEIEIAAGVDLIQLIGLRGNRRLSSFSQGTSYCTFICLLLTSGPTPRDDGSPAVLSNKAR